MRGEKASGRCEPAVPATGNEDVPVCGWVGRLTPAARLFRSPVYFGVWPYTWVRGMAGTKLFGYRVDG